MYGFVPLFLCTSGGGRLFAGRRCREWACRGVLSVPVVSVSFLTPPVASYRLLCVYLLSFSQALDRCILYKSLLASLFVLYYTFAIWRRSVEWWWSRHKLRGLCWAGERCTPGRLRERAISNQVDMPSTKSTWQQSNESSHGDTAATFPPWPRPSERPSVHPPRVSATSSSHKLVLSDRLVVSSQ